ncbi:MAG: PAS domain-containing protein [Chitinophagaceae bacterium]
MDSGDRLYGEKFIKELTDNVQGIFFRGFFDKQYTTLRIDGSCFELSGYTKEEFISGKDITYLDIIHPEDRKWLRTKRQDQIDSRLPIVNEYRIIGKQGRIKWVKEIVSAQYDEVHEKMVLEGFVQDITPYKTNAFMSNAFTSFQNAVNNGSIVSITDRKGIIIFVNENFCKVSKYSRQELVGKDHNVVNSGYHSKAFFADLWQTLLAGDIWRGQIRNKAKDGSFYWVDTVITPVMNDSGEVDQFLSIRNLITDQKENEYALLESEALNRSVLKSLQTNIAILDETGLIVKVNENWTDFSVMNGQPNLFRTSVGANYLEVVQKAIDEGDPYAAMMKDGIHKVLNNELDFYEMEYPCHGPDKERWFLAHVSKFENDIKRIIISHFDISHRKHQEEVLRKSESRLMQAQRIAKLGNWELDLQTNALYWSDENFDIYELDKDKVTANYEVMLSRLHPDDRPELGLTYRRALESREKFEHTHRLLFDNGKIKYVTQQCEFECDEQGKPIRAFGTTQDITSQKLVDQALEKERLRYKHVVENISDGLIIDNIEGKVTFANQQFLDMIGIEESDLDNFVFVDYVSPEFKDVITDRHTRRMKGEAVSTIFQYAGVRKDGTKRWFEARVTKIMENGKIAGTQSAIRDITEEKASIDLLKASEAEKTKLLNELTKRYNELMQFNYIVSHNLRAPIANLLGLAEVFEMPALDDAEKLKIIGHIRYSIEKIDDLIQDLNIILAARSDINSKKELVDFEEIIHSVKQTLEKQISETNTHINSHIEYGAHKIFSIKSYIKSSIYNLVSNAIKYRSPERVPIIDISISRDDDFYTIKVADNGTGIDLEKYGKEVFGLYKRFHLTVEGKGLGLNMTKAQIEALGGSIDILSAPDRGTTFIITIPVQQGE